MDRTTAIEAAALDQLRDWREHPRGAAGVVNARTFHRWLNSVGIYVVENTAWRWWSGRTRVGDEHVERLCSLLGLDELAHRRGIVWAEERAA